MKKPFRISEINLDNILYSNPVVKDDKTNILLKYNNGTKKQQFIIQTPELVCLSSPILKNDIYEINIDLQAKSSKKINNLLEFINSLDNKMQNLGKNNNSWFNNNKSIYRKIIRDDPNHPNGVLKLKVKKSNIPKYLKVTKNKQSETAILSDMIEGYKIKLVIDVFGLWIRKKNNIYYYGIYLKPVLIDYREDINEEISFIEDSDSENNNINEILDTEYEQQYDNTETSIMNIKNIKNIDTDIKMSEIDDSICRPLTITIEDLNKNKCKLSDNNSDMNSSNSIEKNNNFIKKESEINSEDMNSSNSIEINNNFIKKESEINSDNSTNIIGNYDNNMSNTSSIDDTDNFHLTTEMNIN